MRFDVNQLRYLEKVCSLTRLDCRWAPGVA